VREILNFNYYFVILLPATERTVTFPTPYFFSSLELKLKDSHLIENLQISMICFNPMLPVDLCRKHSKAMFLFGWLYPRQPLQFPQGILQQGLHQHGHQGIHLQGGAVVGGGSVTGASVATVGGVLLGGVGGSVGTVGGPPFGGSVGTVGGPPFGGGSVGTVGGGTGGSSSVQGKTSGMGVIILAQKGIHCQGTSQR